LLVREIQRPDFTLLVTQPKSATAGDGFRYSSAIFYGFTPAPTMGVPVGFWWSELTHPYYVLTERGYSVLVTRPCVTDPAVLEVNGLSDMGVDLLRVT